MQRSRLTGPSGGEHCAAGNEPKCDAYTVYCSKGSQKVTSDFWPWPGLIEPEIFFLNINTEFASKSSINQETSSASFENPVPSAIERLNELIGSRQNDTTSLSETLSFIHSSWTTTILPVFDESAMRIISEFVSTCPVVSLPVLFELEAFAALSGFLRDEKRIGSGFYNGYWIELLEKPIADCLPTELCENARLFDELLNLPQRGFAPLIVNEFDCIADGNHRLISFWIWNILKHCLQTPWDLGDPSFLQKVAEYCSDVNMPPVARHQALSHLALFLIDEEQRTILKEFLVSRLRQFKTIDRVPVLLLPEYCALAVDGSYRDSQQMSRIHPAAFEMMARDNALVLPPRTSYHFADCAPLPWFRILAPENSIRIHRMHRSMSRLKTAK